MSSIVALIQREPAVVVTLAAAVLGLAVAFGVPISTEQKVAIDALLTVIAGLLIRSRVTPVAP